MRLLGPTFENTTLYGWVGLLAAILLGVVAGRIVSGLLISVAGVGFRFMRLRWLLMVIVGFCAATWIVEWSAYIVDFYYPDQYLLDGETLSWQAVTYPAQWLLLSIANWHMFFGPPSAIYFGRHAVPSPPGTISQGETSPSSTAE